MNMYAHMHFENALKWEPGWTGKCPWKDLVPYMGVGVVVGGQASFLAQLHPVVRTCTGWGGGVHREIPILSHAKFGKGGLGVLNPFLTSGGPHFDPNLALGSGSHGTLWCTYNQCDLLVG